jgi:murein DD-endopeptidase MepM/ murein hydrolase activator NlpD
MRKVFNAFILLIAGIVAGCDLQPKIASIPDSVGDFISERYPTLLAEPDSEIYKTAVADYGVYASPTVYGNGDVTGEDYVLYSSADDYMMPAQDTEVASDDVGMPSETENDEEEVVTEDKNDDEEESDGYAPDTDVDDLIIPDYVNEKPVEKAESKPEVVEQKSEVEFDDADAEMVRAPVREITIEKGDTLYSVSRKYSVPVNDLAVMNKISAPFTLSVGQKLKVPDILSVPKYEVKADKPVVAKEVKVEQKTVASPKKVEKEEIKKTETTPVKKAEQKTPDVQKTKVEQPRKATETKVETKKTVPVAKTETQKKVVEVKKTDAKKAEVGKKIETKKVEPKKTEQKKVDVKQTKKTEIKKTGAKKQAAKKQETKKVEKTPVKKAEPKKQEQKKKARTAQKMVARSSSKFSWPVRGKILSGYGSKSNGLFNDGINIKANRGTTVSAAENGFVAYAGNEVKGMGNLVIIQHADGWMTVYAHMDSMSVRRGHSVKVGQKIGTVGMSGKVDQAQLHFEIRKGTKAYNPISYLKK